MLNGRFSMSGGYIAGNKAGGGGGIYAHGANSSVYITGGVIAANTANGDGGGVAVWEDSTLIISSNATITGNIAGVNGGNIRFGKANVTLDGTAAITRGKAANGGGAYGHGANQLNVKGDVLVAKNSATKNGGGIYITNGAGNALMNLLGSAWVVDNTAGSEYGGVYTDSNMPFDMAGSIRITGNTANGRDNNLVLKKGMAGRVVAPLSADAEIRVCPLDNADPIQVAVGGAGYNPGWDDADRFICDLPAYASILKDGSIYFSTAASVSIPVLIMLDGAAYQVTEIDGLYEDGTETYIALNDIAAALAKYGFVFNEYNGSMQFGLQMSDSELVTVPTVEPHLVDGTWRIPVPEETDISAVYFLPNGALTGEHTIEDVPQTNGYWSVMVVDMYGTSQEGVTDVSTTQYIPSGRSVRLVLPTRDFPWDWKVSEHLDTDFVSDISVSEASTTITLSNIYAPVVVTCGSADDSRFTAQYFAKITTLALEDRTYSKPSDAIKAGYLPVIDTSGGKLPKNGITQTRKYLRVLDDGSIQTKTETKRVYEDRSYVYSQAPGLIYADRLYTDGHYDLVELWVLKEGRDPESVVCDDWDIYNKDALGIDSIHDLHLTNSPEYAMPNDTIYVREGAVVRFVYESTSEVRGSPVTFYDYDITDGYIYKSLEDAVNQSNPVATSEQRNNLQEKYYVNTNKQGINSISNYTDNGEGADGHLAFGNANTWNGWDNVWMDNVITQESFSNNGHENTLNKANRVSGNPSLCTFGLVTGLDSNGHIVYAPGVVAPKLFNDGDALGKTAITGHTLDFTRIGDTYTLTSVGGTNATRLDKFNNPVGKGGQTTYTTIYTNNFWPMDISETYGENGHDLMFGSYNDRTYRCVAKPDDGAYHLPESDDSMNHNSYFGMNFSVNFALPEGYLGDLEYCFFGDDDMWVFLDGQLILDIGGVHSSVGEYVNLWDYIKKGDTSNHTLQFFYTERGASGSTCWMHFTIPSATFASDPFESRDGSMKIQKSVVGYPDGGAREYKFNVSIVDADGSPAADDYSYTLYTATGELAQYGVLRKGVGSFSLANGEYAILPHIKAGMQYVVTEDKYNCETSFTIDGHQIAGTEASGTITAGKTLNLSFVNDFSGHPMLPATGGPGFLFWYSMACAVIFIASAFGCIHLRKTRNFYSEV